MIRTSGSWCLRVAAHVALATTIWTGAGWPAEVLADDIPVMAGDTVSVEIYGRPDLSVERTIGESGRLALPLAGRIDVDGLTISEIEESIAELLESAALVENPSVAAEFVRRRNISVLGDVAVPGSYAWLPGLTVREALALSGGDGFVAGRGLSMELEVLSTLASEAALVADINVLEAREARLLAEEGFLHAAYGDPEGPAPDHTDFLDVSAFGGMSELRMIDHESILALLTGAQLPAFVNYMGQAESRGSGAYARATEEAVLRGRIVQHARAWSDLAVQHAAQVERVETLTGRLALIDENAERLNARLDAVLSLQSSGLTLARDVLELQSAVSAAASTQLELIAAIEEARLHETRSEMSIAGFAPERLGAVSGELATVRADLANARARLEPASQAARLARTGRSAASADPAVAYSVSFQIHRNISGQTIAIDARLDDPVYPGDILVVAMIE